MCFKTIIPLVAMLFCLAVPCEAGRVCKTSVCANPQQIVTTQALTVETRISPMTGPVEEIDRQGLFKRFKARREVMKATKELRRGDIDAVFLRESKVVTSTAQVQQLAVTQAVVLPQAIVVPQSFVVERIQVVEPPVAIVEDGATGKN